MDNQPQPPITPSAPTAPNPVQPAPSPQPAVQNQEATQPGTAKTVIVILLLIIFNPLGLILMYVWMKWPVWVKILLTVASIILLILPIIAVSALIAINPKKKQAKAHDMERIREVASIQQAVRMYEKDNIGTLPSTLDELVPEYLAEIPTDPTTDQPYLYEVTMGGQDFTICTTFDSEENAELPNCVDSTNSFILEQ